MTDHSSSSPSTTTPPIAERPGFKVVVLGGRAYPSAEQAVAKLREVLAKDGIVIADEKEIWAERWTDKPVICPWTAKAWIPEAPK